MFAKISGNSFGPVLASVYKRAALQASESGGNDRDEVNKSVQLRFARLAEAASLLLTYTESELRPEDLTHTLHRRAFCEFMQLM